MERTRGRPEDFQGSGAQRGQVSSQWSGATNLYAGRISGSGVPLAEALRAQKRQPVGMRASGGTDPSMVGSREPGMLSSRGMLARRPLE